MEGVNGWDMGATFDRMVWVVTEGILKRFNWDMRGKSPPAKDWGRVQRKDMYICWRSWVGTDGRPKFEKSEAGECGGGTRREAVKSHFSRLEGGWVKRSKGWIQEL